MRTYKKDIEKQVLDSLEHFEHSYHGQVRHSEVDSFQVVHNLQYHYWIEWAKIEFLKDSGVISSDSRLYDEFKYNLIKQELDYFHPAGLGDSYIVYTLMEKQAKDLLLIHSIITNGYGKLLLKSESLYKS